MSTRQDTNQEDWLAGALERHSKSAGNRTKRRHAAQAQVDRMIDAAPQVQRIQVLAERRDVLLFAREDGQRFVYRGREIVPVKYRDPVRPWVGLVLE